VSAHPHRHQPVVALTDVLAALDRRVASSGGRPISLRAVDELLRGRGVGVLLLVLSVPFIVPVSIPLLATVFGLPMIVLGARIALTGRGVIPDFALARELSPAALSAITGGLRRILRPIAFLFRPRLPALFWPVPWRLTGVGICLAAVVLSLPLPIPFANAIPAIGLIHFAAGLLQRDGVALCIGHAFTIGAFVYLYLIWGAVTQLLTDLFA